MNISNKGFFNGLFSVSALETGILMAGCNDHFVPDGLNQGGDDA